MGSAEEPLLSSTYGVDDVVSRLEAGLGLQGGLDFQALLNKHPDTVLEVIIHHGTKLLGTFEVKDVQVLPLIRDNALWTMGADSMDIDWESAWRQRLHDVPTASMGSAFETTVEVEAYVVTIKNAALPKHQGILSSLLEKQLEGRVAAATSPSSSFKADLLPCDSTFCCVSASHELWSHSHWRVHRGLTTKIFGVPAVQAVIQWKWDTWARQWLVYEFLIFLVWLVSFQVFVWLFQDELTHHSIRQLIHTPRGAVTVVSAALPLAAISPFVYVEACLMAVYSFRDWFNIWNSLDLLTYVLQIAIAVMYFGRLRLDSLTFSVLLATQILLLFWKIQYFSRAFQPLKNSFVETLRTVIVSVRWFLVLLLLTLWGFAGAFYILFRDEAGDEFTTMWHSFLTCFSFMVSDFDISYFYSSQIPVVGSALLIVFIFSMCDTAENEVYTPPGWSMVLLNALIAVMSDAAASAADKDGTKFLGSRAEIIDELEQYPAFIHVLKVNPRSASHTIHDSTLWTLTEAKGESPDKDVKSELGELRAKIEDLTALLHRAVPHIRDTSQSASS